MEAKELRIGNWVGFIEENRPEQYWDETIVDLYVLETFIKYPDFFKPIPLTEDWLSSFGFVKEKTNWYVLKRGSKKTNNLKRFHLGEFNGFGEYNTKGGVMSGYISIKHVHQLQNLYFALTGEELELIS